MKADLFKHAALVAVLLAATDNEVVLHAQTQSMTRSASESHPPVRASDGDAKTLKAQGSLEIENGNLDAAIIKLTQALQLDDRYEEAYELRGEAYCDKGNWDDAISDLNMAVKLNPSDAVAFNSRGYAFAREGDFVKAISDYTDAIRINPTFVKAWGNRGNAYALTREFEKAFSDLNKAILLDPLSSVGYASRGDAYALSGDLGKGIDDFSHAVQLNRSDPVAYQGRGAIYFKKGEWEKAIADYNMAIELYKETVELRPAETRVYGEARACNDIAWLRATCPMSSMRDGMVAMSFAKKACQLSEWKNGSYIDTLAVAEAEAGDFEMAMQYERQALGMESVEQEREVMQKRLSLFEKHQAYHEVSEK
jgi:tetratricopeptide (TPR) repeat protein